MSQEKKYLSEFDHLYEGDAPEDKGAGLDGLITFFQEKRELPRSEGESGERVLDYELDSDLIYSAILQNYGIDLFEKQLHWHKVRAMIAGVTGTRLNDVMGYRCAAPGKSKEVDRMKRIWALPAVVSAEDRAALDAFNAQFD